MKSVCNSGSVPLYILECVKSSKTATTMMFDESNFGQHISHLPGIPKEMTSLIFTKQFLQEGE